MDTRREVVVGDGRNRLVLGIDIGSSSAKATLATELGVVVARATVEQRVGRPGGGIAEQDPEAWWTAIRSLVAGTLGRANEARDGGTGRGSDLAGVAISGHFPTLVLADADGHPLAPAAMYADRRADAHLGRAAELAGRTLRGDELLPKLLWYRAERPDLLDRAAVVGCPQDHLVHRLTGVHAIDHRTATRTGLFDPTTMTWNRTATEAIGIGPSALPEVRSASAVAGLVLPGPAGDIGIPAGTPVLVGTGDTLAALIGSGVVDHGDVLVYYGTTTTLDVCTHSIGPYLRDPSAIRDGAPYREVGYAVLGPALEWAAAGIVPPGAVQLASADAPSMAGLDAIAASIGADPGAPYVVPNFLANSDDRSDGEPPVIVGLDVGHGRGHLHRALLESFGFVARAGLEASALASPSNRFVAAGGGAESPVWRQVMSDILGADQAWYPGTDGALGNAKLVAAATCDHDPLGSDRDRWQGPPVVTRVDPHAASVADARYRTWRRLRDAIRSAV